MGDGSNSSGALCVGLDVGYGNLKVVASEVGSNEEITLVLPVGAAPKEKCAKSLSGRIDTGDGAIVLVEGTEWVAGVDPLDIQHFARPTHKDYPLTDEYLALFYAALTKLGRPKIATLVTGLPVDQFYTGRESGLISALTRRLAGHHYIGRAPGGVQVESTVGRVMVVPQPAGAFTEMINADPSVAAEKEGISLVLDVGYYSTDWVVVRKKLVKDEVSGTTTDATSLILSEAAKKISQAYQGVPVSPARLESAYRDNREYLMLGETKVDYLSFILAEAATVSDRVMTLMRSSLRSQADVVDTIIITGGGGALFKRAVERDFPARTTRVVQSADPVLGNARGFMHMARGLLTSSSK